VYGKNHCHIHLASVASASPPTILTQQHAIDLINEYYAVDLRPRSLELIRQFLAHESIQTRHIAVDSPHDLPLLKSEAPDHRIERFTRYGVDLAARAAQTALARAGIAVREVAAIIVEPMQGTAGNIIPPKEFLPAMKSIAKEHDALRKAELLKIADVCSHVPANAPRDFHEALQMYWFCHLAVITELNGWDAFSPGHLDQHLGPFYDAGLADGTIEILCSDHAPHCDYEKEVEFDYAPFGITGLETELALSLMQLYHSKRLGLSDLIAKYTVNPARLLKLNKGTLAVGAAADVTVLDPDREWIFERAEGASKSFNSPFFGWKLKGRPVATIVGGKKVWAGQKELAPA